MIIPIISEDKFNCDRCGLCCKAIDCKYLTADNLCSIYDKRPLVCNIDEGYEVLFKDKMTKKEFYQLNEHYCKVLKEKRN